MVVLIPGCSRSGPPQLGQIWVYASVKWRTRTEPRARTTKASTTQTDTNTVRVNHWTPRWDSARCRKDSSSPTTRSCHVECTRGVMPPSELRADWLHEMGHRVFLACVALASLLGRGGGVHSLRWLPTRYKSAQAVQHKGSAWLPQLETPSSVSRIGLSHWTQPRMGYGSATDAIWCTHWCTIMCLCKFRPIPQKKNPDPPFSNSKKPKPMVPMATDPERTLTQSFDAVLARLDQLKLASRKTTEAAQRVVDAWSAAAAPADLGQTRAPVNRATPTNTRIETGTVVAADLASPPPASPPVAICGHPKTPAAP